MKQRTFLRACISLLAMPVYARVPMEDRLPDRPLLLFLWCFFSPWFSAVAFGQFTLPKLADMQADAIIRASHTYWYDDVTIPPAYAHSGGFHSPRYNISADPTDAPLRHGQGGNANVQFPWIRGGGLDYTKHTTTVKGITLPLQQGGAVWPVVVWTGHLPGHPGIGPERALRWRYPKGTNVWEVLMHEVAGQRVPFEIRRRLREQDYWQTFVYRPFPRCADLADALEKRGVEQHVVANLRARPVLTKVDMTDRVNRTRPAFQGVSHVAWLPVLPVSLCLCLLKETPFRDATGYAWAQVDEAQCFAPTTDTPGQIVPMGYAGTIVGTDTDSCAKCHDGVAKHSRHFDMHRGWYGHVRGDDGIFSFHPIEPNRISYNGATIMPTLNKELSVRGIVSPYDPHKHPGDVYHALSK